MTQREEHIKYRNIKFDCSIMKPILNDKEYKLLTEYGTWMNALYKKIIKPFNKNQIQFCLDLDSIELPTEQHAKIFWKYLRRLEISKNNKLNNFKTTVRDDREDWKKIRNMRF